MTAERWHALPCGNHPEQLLVYAAERTDPPPGAHEATCPYCQAAMAELSELWRPVREWATADVHLPEHFAAIVMRRVRRLVQSPRHAAAVTAKGTTTVTSWVIAVVASAATQATPGIARITGAQPDPRRHRAYRSGADGIDISEIGATDIGVSLGVTAAPAPDLASVADTVRRNVIAAIADHTSIVTAEVDISVDDLAGTD